MERSLSQIQLSNPVWQAARMGDRDRYFCALLAPASARPALMALAAFNGELVYIVQTSSDPQLGEIRLQWWRDTLDRIAAGEAVGSPVADALAQALPAHADLIQLLKGVVDGRSFEVAGGMLGDEQAFEAYLQKTHGILFRASSELIGNAEPTTLKAAREAARAYGRARILCLLPHDLAKGRLLLPSDLLARHGVDAEELFEKGWVPGLEGAIEEVNAQARQALDRARGHLKDADKSSLPAFLPVTLTHGDLNSIARAIAKDRPPAGLLPVLRIARLVWATVRGRL